MANLELILSLVEKANENLKHRNLGYTQRDLEHLIQYIKEYIEPDKCDVEYVVNTSIGNDDEYTEEIFDTILDAMDYCRIYNISYEVIKKRKI